MPLPAISQEIRAPSTPVSPANRLGSEKTPAPTIEPTTIAVSVATLIFVTAPAAGAVSTWSLSTTTRRLVLGREGPAHAIRVTRTGPARLVLHRLGRWAVAGAFVVL